MSLFESEYIAGRKFLYAPFSPSVRIVCGSFKRSASELVVPVSGKTVKIQPDPFIFKLRNFTRYPGNLEILFY